MPCSPFEQKTFRMFFVRFYHLQFSRICQGRVVFAQDSHNRHVAIKLVVADSSEYRIMRFISESAKTSPGFNGILPAVDFLQLDQHWFVVMPRLVCPYS
jgi:hypothetical protein